MHACLVRLADDSDEEEDTTAAAADQEAAEEEGERAGTSRVKRSALHDTDDSDAFVDEERVERSNSYMEAMEVSARLLGRQTCTHVDLNTCMHFVSQLDCVCTYPYVYLYAFCVWVELWHA